jgi:septum formation protein
MVERTSDLILASGSSTRRKMLAAAGVLARVVPSTVDEPALRAKMSGIRADDVALNLATAKAQEVSALFPSAFVIGADQLLDCQGEVFAKAPTLTAARSQLELLRGKTHTLPTAVTLVLAGRVIWSHVERPSLTMRDFSSDSLTVYLTTNGDRVCETVGCYEIEGLGAQLFERIEGDYFSILGLPLIPLLAKLRVLGVLAA